MVADPAATQHRLRATRLKTSQLNNSPHQLLREVEQSTFLVLEGVDPSTCRQYKVVVKALAVDQFRFHRLVDQAHVNAASLSQSRNERT